MRVSTVRRVCVCVCGGKVALHFKRLAKVRISCSITYVQWVAFYHSSALLSSPPLPLIPCLVCLVCLSLPSVCLGNESAMTKLKNLCETWLAVMA